MRQGSILQWVFVFSIPWLLILGCTRSEQSDPETLVVAMGAGPNTLDPRFATDAAGMRLTGLLFNSLVRLGPDLKVIGDAASEWSYKDLTYTFTLRPGLKFSDGAPLTTDDILFSFEQFRSAKSPFNGAYKSIKGVDAKYDDTDRYVKISLESFSATLLTDLTPLKLLPKKIVEKAGEDFSKQIVGTGSFNLEKQDANEIVLKSKDQHPLALPKVKKIVFKIIRDDNTRYLKMLKGDIDVALNEIPPTKVGELEKKSELQVIKYPGLSMTYILLNLQDPILKQLPVRKALARAINRDEIIKYKLDGLATPATSILSTSSPYFNSALHNPPFELDAAKAELAKLGLSGKELTLKTSNTQTAIENGKVLANQLQNTGLIIKQQSFEWGTFYGDVQKGNFQMATMRWVGTTDPDIYRTAFMSTETPPVGRNRGHYKNAKLDQLVVDGIKIADEQKRIEHYQLVQKIIHDDMAIIPLWYDQDVAVLNRRVQGFVPSRSGDYSSLLAVSKQ